MNFENTTTLPRPPLATWRRYGLVAVWLAALVASWCGMNDYQFGTDTVKRARALSGARLFVDRGGVESARFGATTSGLVMLFDRDGVCRYAGGITVCRAHEGDNVGRDSVEQILLGRSGSARQIPAFGCWVCLPQSPAGSEAEAETPTVRSTARLTMSPS